MSRYYDSNTGRFINVDSYVSTGQGIIGNNMYAYCNNNPVMFIDSEGARSELMVCFQADSHRMSGGRFSVITKVKKNKYGEDIVVLDFKENPKFSFENADYYARVIYNRYSDDILSERTLEGIETELKGHFYFYLLPIKIFGDRPNPVEMGNYDEDNNALAWETGAELKKILREMLEVPIPKPILPTLLPITLK